MWRKGRGTIDNIFILNHLIQREGLKENKKIFTVFIDLKAACDNSREGDTESNGGKRDRQDAGGKAKEDLRRHKLGGKDE